MVSLERMKQIFKNKNYSEQQLLGIRTFMYNLAEMQLMFGQQ